MVEDGTHLQTKKRKELEHIYIYTIVSREVDGAFTLKQPKSMGVVYALFTSSENVLTSVISLVDVSDWSNWTQRTRGPQSQS